MNISSHCACGNKLTTEHVFSCAKGGFPSIRHNEIRDITASLLIEVCNNVSIEPELQPLSSESFHLASAITDDGDRLDIGADGFWGSSSQRTLFDVRVFNPLAPSNRHTSIQSCYRKHELEMKKAYSQRVKRGRACFFHPPPLSYQLPVGLEMRQRPFTSGWLQCLLINGTNATPPQPSG